MTTENPGVLLFSNNKRTEVNKKTCRTCVLIIYCVLNNITFKLMGSTRENLMDNPFAALIFNNQLQKTVNINTVQIWFVCGNIYNQVYFNNEQS